MDLSQLRRRLKLGIGAHDAGRVVCAASAGVRYPKALWSRYRL